MATIVFGTMYLRIGPVNLAVSPGFKGSSDVTAIGARGSVPSVGELVASLDYSIKDVGGVIGDVATAGGSVSWLSSFGVSVTGAYSTVGDNDSSNPDPDFYLIKLGYESGKHAFPVNRAGAEGRATEGDSAKILGVGSVYAPAKWVDVYAGYNIHSLGRNDYDYIKTLLVGTRVKICFIFTREFGAKESRGIPVISVRFFKMLFLK